MPYDGHQTVIRNGRGGRNEASTKTRCTLRIDMNGGEGVRRKNLTIETPDFRPEIATFYVKPSKPSKHNYEFDCFEAPPCREGDRPQYFSREDAEKGFHVSFVCSKKRRSFVLTAKWKIIRPFVCSLKVTQRTDWGDMSFLVSSFSKIDDNGEDYVEFDVSEINGRLYKGTIVHASLVDCVMPAGNRSEWSSEDLQEGMKMRMPCIGERSEFTILVETKAAKIVESKAKNEKDSKTQYSESGGRDDQSPSEAHRSPKKT